MQRPGKNMSKTGRLILSGLAAVLCAGLICLLFPFSGFFKTEETVSFEQPGYTVITPETVPQGGIYGMSRQEWLDYLQDSGISLYAVNEKSHEQFRVVAQTTSFSRSVRFLKTLDAGRILEFADQFGLSDATVVSTDEAVYLLGKQEADVHRCDAVTVVDGKLFLVFFSWDSTVESPEETVISALQGLTYHSVRSGWLNAWYLVTFGVLCALLSGTAGSLLYVALPQRSKPENGEKAE